MESTLTMCAPKDSKRLTFERMLLTRDRDVIWRVLEMGSVWMVPSIISIRMNSSRC